MAFNVKGLEIPYSPDVDKFKNGGWLFQWCCGCGLRHVYHFEIIRGKSPKSDEVHIRSCRDDWSTKTRRRITKLLKPPKRKRGKSKKGRGRK